MRTGTHIHAISGFKIPAAIKHSHRSAEVDHRHPPNCGPAEWLNEPWKKRQRDEDALVRRLLS